MTEAEIRALLLAAHASMYSTLEALSNVPALCESSSWQIWVRQIAELSGERLDALLEDPLGNQRAACRRAIVGLEQTLAKMHDQERCS